MCEVSPFLKKKKTQPVQTNIHCIRILAKKTFDEGVKFQLFVNWMFFKPWLISVSWVNSQLNCSKVFEMILEPRSCTLQFENIIILLRKCSNSTFSGTFQNDDIQPRYSQKKKQKKTWNLNLVTNHIFFHSPYLILKKISWILWRFYDWLPVHLDQIGRISFMTSKHVLQRVHSVSRAKD